MAAKGVTAFAFSENPAPLGLPTIHDGDRYWDPVMAAANELGMVASMHVGSSSQVPQIAPDSPFMANLAWGAIRTSGSHAVLALQRNVPAVSRTSRSPCPRARSAGCPTSWSGPSRCSTSSGTG